MAAAGMLFKGEQQRAAVEETAYAWGVVYCFLSTAAFCIVSALVRLASTVLSVPILHIVLVRSLISIAAGCSGCLLIGLPTWPRLSWKGHALLFARGLCDVLSSACFYYAVGSLPLGLATVVFFTNPIWTAIISAAWLSEPCRGVDILGAVLAMAGVTLASSTKLHGLGPAPVAAADHSSSDPSPPLLQRLLSGPVDHDLAVWVALGAAVGQATTYCLIRRLSTVRALVPLDPPPPPPLLVNGGGGDGQRHAAERSQPPPRFGSGQEPRDDERGGWVVEQKQQQQQLEEKGPPVHALQMASSYGIIGVGACALADGFVKNSSSSGLWMGLMMGPPGSTTMAIMLVIGACAISAQLMLNLGGRRVPAPQVAMIRTLDVPLALCFQHLMGRWVTRSGEAPVTGVELVGGGLVVFAAFLTVQKRQREIRAAAAAGERMPLWKKDQA